ncbi:hypothetical protein GUITHDRAFT_120722 [Guillardia theta CCMP2712]|uniref:Uncharacterized protein n=1 Tax=Guillardia theta (strain CCMP2712) TaxID=905079 RepID=L1IA51_GUITC|nr:hypothetical protein GUITHDRAFT_120722 [Guillardia theta CCMP2712]EKX33108.1 hypothetical protein GUITHDRAFT_120722 [Guillardia theta CCMP2712]|eukprot:XP_005820088.1 hypothetical protein GUITHDRAFT_120722 [Guillardia theta CCMP2712]
MLVSHMAQKRFQTRCDECAEQGDVTSNKTQSTEGAPVFFVRAESFPCGQTCSHDKGEHVFWGRGECSDGNDHNTLASSLFSRSQSCVPTRRMPAPIKVRSENEQGMFVRCESTSTRASHWTTASSRALSPVDGTNGQEAGQEPLLQPLYAESSPAESPIKNPNRMSPCADVPGFSRTASTHDQSRRRKSVGQVDKTGKASSGARFYAKVVAGRSPTVD